MNWLTFLIPSFAMLWGLAYETLWPPLEISRETTYITEPLLPNGRPDYETWLNDRYGRGVTHENNAAVVLVELDGGDGISQNEAKRRAYLEAWGVAAPATTLWVNRLAFERDYQVQVSRDELALSGVANRKPPYDPEIHLAVPAFLEANREAIHAIDMAMQRPRFYLPVGGSQQRGLYEANRMPYQPVLFELHIAYRLRYEVDRAHGDVEGMVNSALSLVRLGRMFQQAPTVLSGAQGQFAENTGLHFLVDLLTEDRCDAKQIQFIRQEIGRLPPPIPMAERFEYAERAFTLAQVIELREHDFLKPNYSVSGESTILPGVSVNELLRKCNILMDLEVSIAKMTDWSARSKAIANLPPLNDGYEDLFPFSKYIEDLPLWMQLEIPDLYGWNEVKFYCTIGNPAIQRNEMSSIVRRDLFEVVLDVAEFRIVHQRYPRDLSELVPDFCEAIPRDRWTDQPLQYFPGEKSFYIYSTGANERDDRGVFVSPDISLRNPVIKYDDLSYGVAPWEDPQIEK